MARGQELEYQYPKRSIAQPPTVGSGRFASLPQQKEQGFNRFASLNKSVTQNKPIEQPIMSAPMTAPMNQQNMVNASNEMSGIAKNLNFTVKKPEMISGTVTAPIQTASAESASIGNIQPGSGFIEVNGKRTAIGSLIKQVGTVAGSGQLASIAQGDNAYNSIAVNAANKSQSLLNAPSKSFIAQDGTTVSEGASAVGAGIVARGLINQAKTFAELSNQNDDAAARVQNSNTNVGEAASQATARNQNLALERMQIADNAIRTKSIVDGNNIDNKQKMQIANLQNQYLDPKTDEKTKAGIASQLNFLSGRESKQTNNFEPVMMKDELQNQIYAGSFNKQTGQFNPQISQSTTLNNSSATQVPAGYIQIGTANGKPVYQDKDGKRFQ